jgi:hypothetical protein
METGSVVVPIWLFVLLISSVGSMLTMIGVGLVQFTKLKTLTESLKETVENMRTKIESLTTTAASLREEMAVVKALRQEDRERIPTPVHGIEYERIPTPPPFRPKGG